MTVLIFGHRVQYVRQMAQPLIPFALEQKRLRVGISGCVMSDHKKVMCYECEQAPARAWCQGKCNGKFCIKCLDSDGRCVECAAEKRVDSKREAPNEQ
jgi:hypothetical protein